MRYSINDVETLTGIKAHTLRIWEKRYKTPVPHRTATHIRYYDDEQVRRLLNISTLLKNGHKPSRLLNMPDQDINKLILQGNHEQAGDQLYHVYIADLIKSMIAFDERHFDKICTTVITRYGIYDTMLKVIYPFLEKTGVLWSTTNVIPAQEHFASNVIRRKLSSAIDGIPFPGAKAMKYLLFLPPGEWHETGLMLADYMIRNEGHETTYLGQNVPYINLRTTIEKTRPDYLITFIAAGNNAKKQLTEMQELSKAHNNIPIIVCGKAISTAQHKPANILLAEEPNDLLQYL